MSVDLFTGVLFMIQVREFRPPPIAKLMDSSTKNLACIFILAGQDLVLLLLLICRIAPL